jgi:outer membrane biosynthesis protein TonB
VLKTLDSYIEDSQSESGFLPSLWARVGRDRRFTFLFTLSVIFHVIFYAVIVKLDFWSMQGQKSPAGKQVEIVQFAEVAPPPDRYKMRPAPESLDRVDIDRLQFDPNNADDTRLLSRSPRPTRQRGNNAPLPSADEIERQAKASRGAGNRGAVNTSPNQTQPPAIASVPSSGMPQPDSPVIAQAPIVQPSPAPPAPTQKQNAPAPANNNLETAQAGARRGDSSESNAFALQSSQGQYVAYVRAKIIKENEALLLREYIKDVLNDKVAAVFELRLRRDGRILDLRLVRSSGYPRLDARGREAIYIASPFKGYPESAGDLPPFTVTLNYFPLW